MKVVWSYPLRIDILGVNGRGEVDVRVVRPVVYCFDLDGDGKTFEFDYIVPEAFVCDLASVPDKLASIAANKLESAAGALFHDHWCREATKLGWSRKLGDDLARLIWRTPGHGSHVSDAEAWRMHKAIRLYSELVAAARL